MVLALDVQHVAATGLLVAVASHLMIKSIWELFKWNAEVNTSSTPMSSMQCWYRAWRTGDTDDD
jgi:hypothetical protein